MRFWKVGRTKESWRKSEPRKKDGLSTESKVLFCIEKQVCKNILAWKYDKSNRYERYKELEENFLITIENGRAFIHCISAIKIVRIPIMLVEDNGTIEDGKIIIIPKYIIEMISKDKSVRNVVDFLYDGEKIKFFLVKEEFQVR